MSRTKDRARLIETIRHFRLIDDTYFNNFMDDNYVCMQLMLRIILDDSTLEVQHIQTQREVANIYGRGSGSMSLSGTRLELNTTSKSSAVRMARARNGRDSTAVCSTASQLRKDSSGAKTICRMHVSSSSRSMTSSAAGSQSIISGVPSPRWITGALMTGQASSMSMRGIRMTVHLAA